MSTVTDFRLQSSDGVPIFGQYQGQPQEGVIVLVHGFGVKRDARGMFSDVIEALEHKWLLVSFDLVAVDDAHQTTEVYDLETQAKMLAEVLQHVQEKLHPRRVSIVAHSQGCLVVGLLAPKGIDKIVLLASPLGGSYDRLKKIFASRPGTVLNEQGLSRLQRSDGSWTLIPARFWVQLKKIQPVEVILSLLEMTDVFFVKAAQDEIVTQMVDPRLPAAFHDQWVVQPGDHNFSGEYRRPLLELIDKILN